MRKEIIVLIVLLTNFSCFSQFVTPEMKKIFSEKQILDLKVINDFFIQSVCGAKEIIDYKSCFEKEIPYILEYGVDSIAIKVNFEDQKKMYRIISDSTFNEIWGYLKMWKNIEREPTYKWMGVKAQGKYINYLEEVGIKIKYISEYQDSLLSAGDLPMLGTFLNNVYKSPSNMNLNNPNIQLITSIHMITVLDMVNRNEFWESE